MSSLTPRTLPALSKEALSEKLDALARCISRIESKKPFTVQQLKTDFDLQDILSANLARATEACVSISAHCMSTTQEIIAVPTTLAEGFRTLVALGWIQAATAEKMAKAANLRSRLVHEHQRVDWAIIHAVADQHLDDFREFARQIAAKAKLP